MKKQFLFILLSGTIFGNDFGYNGSITSSFGDNYDFYSYAENRLDLNLFQNNISAWVQYEYSNPPEIGFTYNNFRKFRFEYGGENLTIKAGDLYEFWGRGLVLNQIDDQSTNFDNGVRGLYFEYTKGAFSGSHINGNADIWNFGNDLRTPYYNNKHNIMGNQFQYEGNSISLGLTQLNSNEEHQKLFGTAFVTHNLKGLYGSLYYNIGDVFFEYVDKKSFEKTDFENNVAHDTLKFGHGFYLNNNIYLGSWGLAFEYKRYAFDRGHTDFTADQYGNRIAFQMMPTLGREQNMTLLGRTIHQYNYNDERGIQLELTGSLPFGIQLIGQYAHLSRNDTWQSETLTNWNRTSLDGWLPSNNPSSLPYKENYGEVGGFLLNNKLYYRIGRGENEDVLKVIRYFDGQQQDMNTNTYWVYDTTEYDIYGYTYYVIDSSQVIDTSWTDPYNVESKLWQEKKSFTIPLELSYVTNSGYSFGLSFEYQEMTKKNVTKGNSSGYHTSSGTWTLYDSNNPDSSNTTYTTQFTDWNGQSIDTQINRMVTVTISKASKWALAISHDQSNAFDGPKTTDPYYNPLEALIFGDLKYFTGKRDKAPTPRFGQQRWVSAELAYNITSAQRLSVMYGSIQGGLFCSNGICRQIPPFNDGIRINYSMIF